jgi:hypothetical protein
MSANTTEVLRSLLVEALEDLDDADRKGQPLSRDAIAALCMRLIAAYNAAAAGPTAID